MKKILCCLALVFVVFAIPVSAAETDSTQSQDDAMFQEYYEQQAEDSVQMIYPIICLTIPNHSLTKWG